MMSNPIDQGPRPAGPGNPAPARGDRGEGVSGEAGGSAKPERVTSGDAAAESDRLQSVRQRIDQTPDVDRERVEAIKAKLASGDYPVDAEKIARKFAQLESMIHDE